MRMGVSRFLNIAFSSLGVSQGGFHVVSLGLDHVAVEEGGCHGKLCRDYMEILLQPYELLMQGLASWACLKCTFLT